MVIIWLMTMKKMKIEPELVLPYEDLPDSNNELIKSLKIIQETIKYYGTLIKELHITLNDLDRKVAGLMEPSTIRSSMFDQGKGFSKEDIQKIFKKK